MPNETKTNKDPVCGMTVNSEQHSTTHHGKKVKFCSQGCLDKFKKNPTQFENKI